MSCASPTRGQVGKRALIAHQRYAHAKQFQRANRVLKTIRTYLGRVTRDIVRKIQGDAELESVFAHPLMLGRRVREQRQHQRGRKGLPSGSVPRVYSLHAPEVECIGKGKAHRPYEFGVKVSIATTLHRSAGGQFIAHAKALPGNPYDGHTRDRDPGDRDADRREPCPHRRRPRLSRPQPPRRPQVLGLYLRPETPRHRDQQTRVAPPFRHRTGHLPRESGAPGRATSPEPTATPAASTRRRRLQLPPSARMAGSFVVRNLGRSQNRHSAGAVQIGLRAFFTRSG